MVGGNRFCFVEYSMPGVSTGCWAVLPVLGAQHARRQSPSRSAAVHIAVFIVALHLGSLIAAIATAPCLRLDQQFYLLVVTGMPV